MELYYFVVVIFFASILQGVTGFGSALIAAPLLLLLLDKTTSVVSLTLVSLALNLFLFLTIKHNLDRKSLSRLFLPSLLGLPLGVYILQHLDSNVLKISAGVMSITFTLLLFSKKIKIEWSENLAVASGFFSGILHTSIGIGGPPVVLLLASYNTYKDEMRRTLAFLFFVMSLVSVTLFWGNDYLTPKILHFSFFGVLVAFLGGYVGNKISKKVSQKQFMFIVLLLVSITVLVAMYSGISGIRSSLKENALENTPHLSPDA